MSNPQYNFKYQQDASQSIVDFFNQAKARNSERTAYNDLLVLDAVTKQKAQRQAKLSGDTYNVGTFEVFKVDLDKNQSGDEFYIDKKLAQEWLPKA
jgi:hypothetical protein